MQRRSARRLLFPGSDHVEQTHEHLIGRIGPGGGDTGPEEEDLPGALAFEQAYIAHFAGEDVELAALVEVAHAVPAGGREAPVGGVGSLEQIGPFAGASLGRLPVERGETEAAAVGSRLAARTYHLEMLEENIEDHPDNVTRFLSIGKAEPEPTGKDKSSILFFLNHKPGALHNALGILDKNGINMTRIESRPMKIRNWEYLFFVDIEGHEKDSNVHEAIMEMERTCPFIKQLGSYPAAVEPWE